jgi:heme/copper-type cytochrome/quinol oxidase subunit 2
MNQKYKIEIIWIVAVLAILFASMGINFYVTGMKSFSVATKETPGEKTPGTLIQATGVQWSWSFEINGVKTVDNFTLTVNQTYTMVITSLPVGTGQAVIHDLLIPEFGIQVYAVPGQNNTITFTPDKTGTFIFECVEYCGYDHYKMRGYFTVVK